MRPVRLLLALLFSFLFVSLLSLLPRSQPVLESSQTPDAAKSRFRAFFSFHTPLFPPSAVISLTDDNSTFFLSRPAAFGPLLPSKGLSGQLWIGSGFGEDNVLGHGLAATAEGELGCSDVPGWDATLSKPGAANAGKAKAATPGVDSQIAAEKEMARRSLVSDPDTVDTGKTKAALRKGKLHADDGTDDYLHHPLPDSELKPHGKASSDNHADIQSLQESAEIAGKVVLLSRGGCGFLEKVKWAQRRGGIALIVGDDVRGGPLVTMYARGDTSNVTIPALFTSYTTAHLLSSLIPTGGAFKLPAAGITPKPKGKKEKITPKQPPKDVPSKPASDTSAPSAKDATPKPKKGWFRSLFAWLGFGRERSAGVSVRPPSSGSNDWVLEDIEEAKNEGLTDKERDSFVIGVHDWRDPDLVLKDANTAPLAPRDVHDLKGGSTTPGSGEYSADADAPEPLSANIESPWWHEAPAGQAGNSKTALSPGSPRHDGLWVTLTPTNMSSSPFFDTLLVLVVSPLVTLTVVYALLLLRSRIRRRRWRAPKSVVDRLPVRTYHTIAGSEASTPARVSPTGTSPTTPLLQPAARPGPSRSPSRSRPRSRTASEVPEGSARGEAAMSEAEKREAGLAEWRRRYGGRQRECVVCLEEYVDGVSRVMSLPCGHEFHVECITPWLTTRRRTCPICKGDVVRSLARNGRGEGPSRQVTNFSDEEDEDGGDEEEAADHACCGAHPPSADFARCDAARLPPRALRVCPAHNARAPRAQARGFVLKTCGLRTPRFYQALQSLHLRAQALLLRLSLFQPSLRRRKPQIHTRPSVAHFGRVGCAQGRDVGFEVGDGGDEG
ncbi:hypothetical protein EJ06DRAFT_539398 [Trichodelitschia bisporula]|uniref:RING-type domain-containing protein n=1 Tax=Trichodelitschia bisporula TaxID=703511 RepID=A0A6G1HNG7_9PEZI|nr:hypothetical protein EJ06DRAFT_539398 [Trichodelitschia bisporula]